MSITLTFLGHAAVLLEDGKHTVAIDPFLTGNPVAARQAADVHCTHIVLTHGHGDHLGDAISLALANDATVYANFEITEYLGVACGAMVHLGGGTVYHCGDTGIFGDMALLGEIYRPDIALIPIGDRFTMGPQLASRAAELIKPKIAVPIHYRTFPLLAQDASGFKPKGVEVRVLQPGETLRC